MPFTVNKSDGTFLVTVQDLTTDQSATSLSLPGKGTTGYALSIAQNFASLVENFASLSAPSRALNGQLWFDKNVSLLRVKLEGAWSTITPDAFGSTLDTLPGPTIAGAIGGTSNGANRLGGSTGVQLMFNGAITTVSILAGEGKIIAVASPEAIPNVSLPLTIIVEGKTFDFKARFPNGLCAGVMLASDGANYIYGGSTQFTDTLLQVPYLLAGDDTSLAANSIVVTVPSAIKTLTKYFAIECKVANTTTGASQITVNGIGPKNIVRRDTSAIQAGDLKAGFYYHFIFDGLQFRVDDAQANGYVGPTGPQGSQGIQGLTGAASTIVGPTGPTGPAGLNGTNGTNASVSSGEGIQIANGIANLDTPDLVENDTIAANDFFSYFSSSDGHHRKTTMSVLASKVLSFNSASSTSSVSTFATKATLPVSNLVWTAAILAGAATGFCSTPDASGTITILKSGIYTIDGMVASEHSISYQPSYTQTAYFGTAIYVNGISVIHNGNPAVIYYYTDNTTCISYTNYFASGTKISLYGLAGNGHWPVSYTNITAASIFITFIE